MRWWIQNLYFYINIAISISLVFYIKKLCRDKTVNGRPVNRNAYYSWSTSLPVDTATTREFKFPSILNFSVTIKYSSIIMYLGDPRKWTLSVISTLVPIC